MVFNATFNYISVISWWSVLLVEETEVPGKTTDLSQVTDILDHIMLYRVITIPEHIQHKTPVIVIMNSMFQSLYFLN